MLDGPFTETREQLGGYFLVDCSLDEALAYAAAIPRGVDRRRGGPAGVGLVPVLTRREPEDTTMRYMLLIYSDRRPFFEMTEEERAANMQEWSDYSTWLAERGWMQAGDALADVEHATSVRLADGERIVTDGPFAETKETLGGYYLIDVSTSTTRSRRRRDARVRGTARSRCAR